MPILDIAPIIAHRGASAYAPENTSAAMIKAKSLGARWVEFDVTITADNQLIVLHDETLERTTNGHGVAAETSYATISQLDAGSWYSEKFRGERIMSFAAMLTLLGDLGLAANIELKPPQGRAEIVTKRVLETLAAYRQQHMTTPPLLSSFYPTVLTCLRQYDKHIQIGGLMHEWYPDWHQLAKQLNLVALHLTQETATFERIQAIKAAGYAVLCYTVNAKALAKKLFDWGVDAIFTDYPDLMQLEE